MHNANAVKVSNGQDNLCSVEASHALVKHALPVQVEEKMPPIDELKYQVQLCMSLHGRKGGWKWG
jgi:hypothetical protein